MSELIIKNEHQTREQIIAKQKEKIIKKEILQIIVPENLKKHCPLWSKILEDHKYNLQHILRDFILLDFSKNREILVNNGMINPMFIKQSLNLEQKNCCIVGEKHNFTFLYDYVLRSKERCDMCNIFSSTLYVHATTNSFDLFNKDLADFTLHCDLEHPVK